MFNVYSYEKKRSSQLEHERKLKLSVGNQGKVKAYRDKLYENYSKRISDFLFHMERQPIIINSFHSPIENAGRMTDPSKFKGKAQIIVRDYKTHKERLQVFFT